MFVKICGTTSLQDAQLSVALGADALGFIFAPSKRQVDAGTAAAIAQALPGEVLRVGVFTRPDPAEVAQVVAAAGLTAVQMHWSYDPQFVKAIRAEWGSVVQLWQVVGFAVNPANREQAAEDFRREMRLALLDSRVDAVLLDAIKDKASGGLGVAFPWQEAKAILEPLLREAEQTSPARGGRHPRLVLAGGLHAENVTEAQRIFTPWGVDVVSGVEASPGKKSPDRLRAFLAAARS